MNETVTHVTAIFDSVHYDNFTLQLELSTLLSLNEAVLATARL